MTSQISQFHLGASCDVFATSQVCQCHLGNSWYIAMTSQIGRIYLGDSETLSQRHKKVRLINMMTSQCGPRRLNLNKTRMRREVRHETCQVGSLSCHEQVCLSGQVAHVDILVHDVINLLYY